MAPDSAHAAVPVLPARTPRARRRRLPVTLLLTHAALIVACAVIAFPLVFAALKATQSGMQVVSSDLRPGGAFLQNLEQAWYGAKLWVYMRNSLVIALSVTVCKTALSLLAALALVHFRFPLKSPVFALILFTLMLPTDLLIVALFDLVSGFGWANTYAAVIVPFLASATGTFLFRQHFMSIPSSLADAARIDGAGPIRYLWHVLLPLSLNAAGALAVIQFVYVWDQYLWPLVIIRDTEHQVVQVGLKSLIGGVGDATEWGVVMAGALITVVPPLLVFTALQQQFSKGFALGQDK